jgi:hypothetical protein
LNQDLEDVVVPRQSEFKAEEYPHLERSSFMEFVSIERRLQAHNPTQINFDSVASQNIIRTPIVVIEPPTYCLDQQVNHDESSHNELIFI